MPDACAAGPPPSAAHVPARCGATACHCTTASSAPASVSSPYTWDWTRWSRHFAEIDQAESYASVLSFQLEEAVETEDFAEAASLKRAILEASADDVVAHVMADLKTWRLEYIVSRKIFELLGRSASKNINRVEAIQ